MYFAHHQGTYIRLAYADRLEEPWTVHALRCIRTIRPAMGLSRRLTYASPNMRGPFCAPCLVEEAGPAGLSVRCGASQLSVFISRNV